MTELQDLLHRATDRIEGPDLAARALTGARRRRARNRGVVAAVAAAAAVVAVVVSVELTTGGARVDRPPVMSPSPSPTEAVATAPAIDPSRVQPVWDPRDVEGLPVTDLGVPRVMESLVPGVVTRPVAVLDDGEQVLLVSAEGRSMDIPVPTGDGAYTASLSPDGTRLAVSGADGFFWRTLDGEWRRAEGTEGEIVWRPGRSSPVLAEAAVAVPQERLGPLEGLQHLVLGGRWLAASRANITWSSASRATDFDGLIAVDRATLETRGFLPVGVPETGAGYADLGAIRPVAWLDEDTVAFTVLPIGAPKEYLVTWDVETGELSRISCWDTSFNAVFATGLLGS